MAPTPRPPEARFWEKVKFNPANKCWEWQGTTTRGHGRFGIPSSNRYRMIPAHRFAYELAFGPIKDDEVICHRCDNRRCVKPAHLFAGTQLDNVRDMIAKGRKAPTTGVLNGHAKLTESQVRELRALREDGFSLRYLSGRFSISEGRVSAVARRETYADIS